MYEHEVPGIVFRLLQKIFIKKPDCFLLTGKYADGGEDGW